MGGIIMKSINVNKISVIIEQLFKSKIETSLK